MAYQQPTLPVTARFFPKSSNFIKYIKTNPCGDNYLVYFETFLPAFIKAVIIQNIPFADDLVRSLGELKAAESLGHRSPKGGKFRKRTLVPAPTKAQVKSQAGLRFLLQATQPLETLGYLFLLYSTTEQLYMDWQTMLMRSEECGNKANSGFFLSKNADVRQGVLPGGSALILGPTISKSSDVSRTGPTIGVPIGTYDIMCEVTLTADIAVNASAELVLFVQGPGITYEKGGTSEAFGRGETKTLIQSWRVTTLFGTTVTPNLVGPALPVGLYCSSLTFWVMRDGTGVV